MKEFKTIAEQIEYLSTYKNINFDNVDRVKEILLNYNYYNIISCSKIRFAKDIVNGCHTYPNVKFAEWFVYYLKDNMVSSYLMKSMIEFEKKLNSRVAYFVGHLVEVNNSISNKVKDKIADLIRDAHPKNLPEYDNHETWKYITNMEFGKMKQIVFYLSDHRSEKDVKIYLDKILYKLGINVNSCKSLRNQLNDLNNLRNHLFHFIPLNIFISNGITGIGEKKRLSNTRRKKAVNFIYNLQQNENIKIHLIEFYNASDHFIKIKNSQHNVS